MLSLISKEVKKIMADTSQKHGDGPILTDEKARSWHFSAQPLIRIISLCPKWHITVIKRKRIWSLGPEKVKMDIGYLQNTKSKIYNRNRYMIHLSMVEIGLKSLKQNIWLHLIQVLFETWSYLNQNKDSWPEIGPK